MKEGRGTKRDGSMQLRRKTEGGEYTVKRTKVRIERMKKKEILQSQRR
jgi:hypothetical protein